VHLRNWHLNRHWQVLEESGGRHQAPSTRSSSFFIHLKKNDAFFKMESAALFFRLEN
jgi:hypothetical protein